jgi:hypothetical protein
MKQFTERAYMHGVVIVRCPKCQKQHLIADRLGYFADDDDKTFDLNTIAKRTGQPYKHITNQNADGTTTTTISFEDIVGADKMKEILQVADQEKDTSEGRK